MAKTATLPPLRVDPKLRSAAEAVLRQGETLSSFIAQSISDTVDSRRAQAEFLARGLAGREQARRTGKYYSAASILADLNRRLQRQRARGKT
jgi:hypothetical protein